MENFIFTETERLERKAEILHLLEYAQKRCDTYTDSINGYGGINFPILKANWEKKRDCTRRAMERIKKCYLKS